MKFDAPPCCGGRHRPGVRVWLGHMEHYIWLTKCPPSDWLDIVAMKVDGVASAWTNTMLVSIKQGRQRRFVDWEDFKTAMIATFEPVTELEEA